MNWDIVIKIYITLYVIDLVNAGLDEQKIIQCIMWDEKVRPDEICMITGRSFNIENHIRETCLNRAIEIVKGK